MLAGLGYITPKLTGKFDGYLRWRTPRRCSVFVTISSGLRIKGEQSYDIPSVAEILLHFILWSVLARFISPAS